ncbi:scarecrow-like protein 33 [Selaginella moellendorffii]|uniref:scarecrow-like protein 33 n=1 Tax=Selaginella moellendorffii TaxID=88036 RepID=UPI000D1D06A8|nr:scarecrow-like protein 33 [Selaginella moellendorffii]|eukprot:XP_024520840.1 scarecrow-like protein 33 [Selaginella moellendorffii]
MEEEGYRSQMTTGSLIPLLQKALLQHQVRIQPLPVAAPVLQLDDPALSYLSKMLLDGDSDSDEQEVATPQQNRYQAYMDDLNSIIRGCVQSPDSDQEQVDQEVFSLLRECARAVAARNSAQVYNLIGLIKNSVTSENSHLKRTALFFVNALVARLKGCGSQLYSALSREVSQKRYVGLLCMNLPWFSATEVISNHIILEACKGAKRIHIVDYGILYGSQWPWLIRALSQRPEGAPLLRMTGIDSSGMIDDSWELAQPQCNSLNEFVVINTNRRLRFLRDDSTAANNLRKVFFDRMLKLQPALLIQSLPNADPNVSSPFFVQRFEATLAYYANILNGFGEVLKDHPQELGFARKFVERSIMNVVACEGVDRVERPGPYYYWDSTAKKAGFEQLPLSDQVIETARLIWRGEKFSLYRDGHWLLLAWKDALAFGICAWKPGVKPRNSYSAKSSKRYHF